MACLRKSKNGAYLVDVTFEGRRCVWSTKTTQHRIALQILHDIEGKIARGTFNLDDYRKKEIALCDLIPAYLTDAASTKKASTVKLEEIHLHKFLTIVGNRNLRTINLQILDQWKSQILKTVNPVTFNIERRVLHRAFNVAKRWGYVETNPVSQIGKLRVEEKRLFLTDKEIRQLYEEIDADIRLTRNSNHRHIHKLFRMFVEFLLNTGLRRGEGIALTWDRLDLQRVVIFIQGTKDKGTRTIPLTRRAHEILVQLGESLFSDLNNTSSRIMLGKRTWSGLNFTV